MERDVCGGLRGPPCFLYPNAFNVGVYIFY